MACKAIFRMAGAVHIGAVHIGTSGWNYKHWRGPFYPEKLPQSKMLDFYAQHFSTVELNNTFYRLPQPNGVKNWHDSTPGGFCFAMKGSRFLTHMKKLQDPATGIERFFERADRLEEKLGPVIFQLPPHWAADAERLENFLRALPQGRHRYVFELRDPTWHSQRIYSILRRYHAAFCIFEIGGFRSGFEVTTDFTYVRLHGPDAAYQGSYSGAALNQWADRIREWRRSLRAVYMYFDNDQAGYAPKNALELAGMVG